MEILNWNKLIAIPILLILYGCGQQTMKDEGLETKSIREAGTSSNNEDLLTSDDRPKVNKDKIIKYMYFIALSHVTQLSHKSNIFVSV